MQTTSVLLADQIEARNEVGIVLQQLEHNWQIALEGDVIDASQWRKDELRTGEIWMGCLKVLEHVNVQSACLDRPVLDSIQVVSLKMEI